MYVWKLMVTALGSGALFGLIGGASIQPTLKPAPEQPWRQGFGLGQGSSSLAAADGYTITEATPQDLSPQGWTYGAAQAFPLDSDRPAARRLGYRWDDHAPPPEADESWSDEAAYDAGLADDDPVHAAEVAPVVSEPPAIEAAVAARDAALDAIEQGLDPAPTVQPAV